MRNPCRSMRLSGKRLITLQRTLALDGFTLIKPLSQGRFGSCFVVSRGTSEDVLKVFNANDVKRRKEKLARESKLLKRIDHPAIPKLIQVIDRDGFYGLVMEKMPGHSLDDLITWDYAFNKNEIAAIISQLIAVLDFLERLEIFHRDIKTDNLLWTGQNLALIDFGSARLGSQRHRRFNPDFWGCGDVFLRLAANCVEISADTDDFSIAGIHLTTAERSVVKRLLYIENPYCDFQTLKEDFNTTWIKKSTDTELCSQPESGHNCPVSICETKNNEQILYHFKDRNNLRGEEQYFSE